MAESGFFDDIENTNNVPSSSEAAGFFDDIPPIVPIKNEIEAEIASGEWTSQDSLAGSLIFLEGMTLGWSDEVGVGLAALATSATTDETREQAYKRLKKDYDDMQEGFATRQPLAATGLEIAGNIVSPVSKIGMAAKAATGITKLAARAGVEGALYGAGKAETGSSVGDIATDAAVGAGVGVASGALFGLPTWLLKRKIEAPLDTPEGFKPITLAADKDKSSEAILQTFYRDVIGPSFGGGGIVRAQEEKIVAPFVSQQAAKEKAIKAFDKKSKAEAVEAGYVLQDQIDDLGMQVGRKIADVREEAKIVEEIIKGNYKSLVNKETGAVIARQTKQLSDIMDSQSDMFRLNAFVDSLPASTSSANKADILDSSTLNSALQKLEDRWNIDGFESIKTRSYQVNPEKVAAEMNKRLSADTTVRLMLENSGQLKNTIQNTVALLAEKTTKGRISGEDLASLRSSFGTAAASKSDVGGAAAIQQYVLRDMQAVLDKEVTKTLSKDRLAKFNADKAAYATVSVLKDAVKSASTQAGKQGRFTPDQWLQSAAKNSPRQVRQGKAPLQSRAEAVSATIKKEEDVVKKAALKLSDKLEARRTKELKRAGNKAKLRVSKLEEDQLALKKNMRRNPENAEKLAANQLELEQMKEAVKASAEELNKIQQLRTPGNPSWFHKFAASGIIGGMTGLQAAATGGSSVASTIGAAMGTIGTAKGLAGEGAQRFLAGQSPLQQAAQNLKDPIYGSEALGTLPLAGARAVTGMLTGVGQ